MPKVGGKQYGYNKAGIKAANAAAKRQGKKLVKGSKKRTTK